MLDDPDEHDFPAAARIISGLTPEQAVTAPPGLPYSVAKILAHMHSNVRFNIGLIRASDPRTFKEKFVNWPEVPSQEWSGFVEAFLRPARSQADRPGDGPSAGALPCEQGTTGVDGRVQTRRQRCETQSLSFRTDCGVAAADWSVERSIRIGEPLKYGG